MLLLSHNKILTVYSLEEVHCRSAISTAGYSDNSDTRSTQVASFHLRVTYRLCQWLLETFGRKSTVWQEISSRLNLMPKTWSLKEDVSKLSMVTVSVTFKANTLKASKVGHYTSWSSSISCLQLWHKAYPSGGSNRQLLLTKDSKKPSIGFVSQ